MKFPPGATADPPIPTGNSAVCVLEATANATGPVWGYATFVELSDASVNITLSVWGLSVGAHPFHVHTYGDVSGPNGIAAGPHFPGVCNQCRPPGGEETVGLLNNGTPIAVDGPYVLFSYIERVAHLSGTNSVLGRALVIHGTAAEGGGRQAQCVIGRWTESPTAPST